MRRFDLYLPHDQFAALQSVADRAGCSVAEIIRRFCDHCLQPKILNVMVPRISGCPVVHACR